MKKNNMAQGKKPFFAKLLAKQELEQETNGFGITTRLGDQAETHKYPSDGDEHIFS